MKKIIIMLSMMLCAYASEAKMHNIWNVPDAVKQSFTQQYPNVSIEKWKMENDTCVAIFKQADRKDFAYFFPDGQWIKTESKMPRKDMPCAVNEAFNKSGFEAWQVDFTKERRSPSENDIVVVQVHKDFGPDGSFPTDCEKAYRLYYDMDGQLLRERKIE